MRKTNIIWILWLPVALAVISGCSYKAKRLIFTVPLPEHVYQQPGMNYYAASSVGVFAFASPAYAPDVGDRAAQLFYELLKEKDVFRRTIPLFHSGYIPGGQQMARAKADECELIITGTVRYYLDGSLTQASRVDVEIHVVAVSSGKQIWHAGAAEIGTPDPPTDYFLFQTAGKPAPAASALMARNLEKFVRLFTSESPAYKALSADMKLVDSGYFYLSSGAYEKAQWHFERAIGLAPNNIHARYYLGIVHEETGDMAAAIDLYARVVALDPDEKWHQAIYGAEMGRPITALARQRLTALSKPATE